MIEKNHGHVVAMSSFCGILGLANAVPYCASKFAVRGKPEAQLYVDVSVTFFVGLAYPIVIDINLRLSNIIGIYIQLLKLYELPSRWNEHLVISYAPINCINYNLVFEHASTNAIFV